MGLAEKTCCVCEGKLTWAEVKIEKCGFIYCEPCYEDTYGKSITASSQTGGQSDGYGH